MPLRAGKEEYPNSVTTRRTRNRHRVLCQCFYPPLRCAVSSATNPQEWRFITMRCPYCKNSQTEVFRTKCLRSRTYRYRRCQFCKAKFRTQERPVRWEGVDRKWPGTAPSRTGWRSNRVLADRKSTRLNSSHLGISYAVFCLKKKKKQAYCTEPAHAAP